MPRRVIGGLATLAAIWFLGYAWLPARTTATPDEPPSLSFSGQASYTPIEPNERGSMGDMLAGVVATTVPRQTAIATPTVEPELSPTPDAQATPTVELTPLPVATSQLEVIPPVSTPTVLTPAAKPAAPLGTSTVPTPQGTSAVAVSPVPRTPTPTPRR